MHRTDLSSYFQFQQKFLNEFIYIHDSFSSTLKKKKKKKNTPEKRSLLLPESFRNVSGRV